MTVSVDRSYLTYRQRMREYQEIIEYAFHGWDDLPWNAIAVRLPEEWGNIPSTAHGIHRLLLEIQGFRKKNQYVIAQMLGTLKGFRLLDELGFANIEHYAKERLGMGRSTAYSYAALEERRRDCPSVMEAMRTGRITFFQALLITQVVRDDDAAHKWIDYAQKAPAKELQVVVEKLEKPFVLRATCGESTRGSSA